MKRSALRISMLMPILGNSKVQILNHWSVNMQKNIACPFYSCFHFKTCCNGKSLSSKNAFQSQKRPTSRFFSILDVKNDQNCQTKNPGQDTINPEKQKKLQEKPQQFYTDKFQTPLKIQLNTIAVVKSPYKERFGTPRQPVVTNGVLGGDAQIGEIVFEKKQNFEYALEDLEGFEYCWLITFFHLNKGWNPKVKPPRGAEDGKKGLFATRSPHRPNNIGLSAVKIHSVDPTKGILRVLGHDLLDGTPVLDVKPYVPYCDAFPHAKAGWLESINKEKMLEADKLDYWPPPPHIQ